MTEVGQLLKLVGRSCDEAKIVGRKHSRSRKLTIEWLASADEETRFNGNIGEI